MLLTILFTLLLLWAIGSVAGYAGSLTTLFLGGAIVLFIINLCSRPGLSREDLR